jgi:pimeloyl-ACP methyl ester carboxylesterase
MGKHFVLIHGAWHGGWAWDGVIQRLEAQGHTAEAPTLPGSNADDDRSRVTFDAYVEKISEVLWRQPRPCVLVGHSSAGFLLQSAAPMVPRKIERLVFLNAWILPSNTAQFDFVEPNSAKSLCDIAQASPDKSVPVIDEFVRNVLMAGEDRASQDGVIGRLRPQPLVLFTTPVNGDAFNQLSTPRSVVYCKDDTSLPPGTFLRMAEALGKYELVEIEGGHEALVTHPDRVADALVRAAP